MSYKKSIEMIHELRVEVADLQRESKHEKRSSLQAHQECLEKDKGLSYLVSSHEGLKRELDSCRNKVEVLQNEIELKEGYYAFQKSKCDDLLDHQKYSLMVERRKMREEIKTYK